MIRYFKQKRKLSKTGFSLLELVLAIAIFSLGSFAIATMLIDSTINTKLSTEKLEAIFFAKEGIEAVRSIRDNDLTVWLALTDGDYGLATSSEDRWEFSGSSDLIENKYTRVVNILASSTETSIKNVSVSVSWNLTPARLASTTLSTIITNWKQ